jgi:ferredoxin--NADP+ reductase
MYKVSNKWELASGVYMLEIEAPAVAQKAAPGQFVMLMVDEKGERIPLSIADWNRQRGTVSIVVSQVGTTTGKLSHLEPGDTLPHFAGPLGKPAEIACFGNVACVAIGYGMTTIVPIARALKEAGNTVYSIVGAPTKADLLKITRLGELSQKMIVATSDGSCGEQGWVIEPLRRLLGEVDLQRIFVIGSLCMMKLVSATTKEFGIKTMVSLNPIMVDGTGMCGACRCSVGGKTRFACVDGPEFDGHEVEWNLLLARRCTYPVKMEETASASRCQFCGQW